GQAGRAGPGLSVAGACARPARAARRAGPGPARGRPVRPGERGLGPARGRPVRPGERGRGLRAAGLCGQASRAGACARPACAPSPCAPLVVRRPRRVKWRFQNCSLPEFAMPSFRRTAGARTAPRGLLVFDTRVLDHRLGAARAETRTVPAPAELHTGMAWIPQGAELDLEVRLESVTEGVLVTAAVTAPVAGECARCLEPVSQTLRVRCRALFSYEH